MGKAIVAIVGRPNVGKSTLFNRIIGSRLAIVEGMPGVTRDRLYHDADWNGKIFTLVDTGGIDISLNDEITGGVRRQAEIAIKEADAILFVVDARAGLTAVDTEVANILRKTDTPVLLVANKVEQYNKPGLLSDFYALGLGEPIPVSAAEGLNTGDMLDSLVEMLPSEAGEEEEDDNIRIAVIGRPNVGKSSLVNKLLGEERVIVSSIPGTTRDSIDTLFTKDGKNYILVDTAGLRRKSKIDINTEKYSVIRTLRAVDRCDLVFMLIDATEGVTDQDKRIAGYAHEQGRAAVLVVNKWDLIEKDDKTANKFTDTIRKELGFMQYAPVIFLSALTGQRVPKVLDLADRVAENHTFRISTSQLNNLIKEAVQQNPPPSYKTRRLKIYYCNQSGVKPPRFILFVNDKELVHFSYSRYLENQVRDAYGFEGTPLWFSFRSKEKEE